MKHMGMKMDRFKEQIDWWRRHDYSPQTALEAMNMRYNRHSTWKYVEAMMRMEFVTYEEMTYPQIVDGERIY